MKLNQKNKSLFASLVFSIITVFVVVHQAEAAGCGRAAKVPDGSTYGRIFAQGHATARKKGTACRRAYRRCMRDLRRKLRKHGRPRGLTGCVDTGLIMEPSLGKPKRVNPYTKPSRPDSKPPSS